MCGGSWGHCVGLCVVQQCRCLLLGPLQGPHLGCSGGGLLGSGLLVGAIVLVRAVVRGLLHLRCRTGKNVALVAAVCGVFRAGNAGKHTFFLVSSFTAFSLAFCSALGAFACALAIFTALLLCKTGYCTL